MYFTVFHGIDRIDSDSRLQSHRIVIRGAAVIDQNTEKPDITTTTAIRMLLDRAADAEEALDLLEQYDLHGSKGMMVHFALSDTKGRSVSVEYVDQQMVVTDTPVVTNFYLAQGEKKESELHSLIPDMGYCRIYCQRSRT